MHTELHLTDDLLNEWLSLCEIVDSETRPNKWSKFVMALELGLTADNKADRESAYANIRFVISAKQAIPILISEVRRLNTIALQLEKEADWLALHAPAEAYECGAGFDMTCACGHLIDFKNKKRCPFWVDYYGEYKDACPNNSFEEWKDYVFNDYDNQVNCAFDKQKCWREAARKAVECE